MEKPPRGDLCSKTGGSSQLGENFITEYHKAVKNGLTRKELANKLGVTEKTVKNKLNKYNLDKTKLNKRVKINDAEFKKEYQKALREEKTTREVADIFGCSQEAVRKKAAKLGYHKLNTHGGDRKSYKDPKFEKPFSLEEEIKALLKLQAITAKEDSKSRTLSSRDLIGYAGSMYNHDGTLIDKQLSQNGLPKQAKKTRD